MQLNYSKKNLPGNKRERSFSGNFISNHLHRSLPFNKVATFRSVNLLKRDYCTGAFLRIRSSHRRCFIEKGVLKTLAKFTGKHLCWSLFFNKVAGLQPSSLLKKRLQHMCFPVNFAKFLRTPFFKEHHSVTAPGEL